MKSVFKTKNEARDFLNGEIINSIQVVPEIVHIYSDDLISQEHFSFFDFELNGNYNASILETKNGFEVDINFKKHSPLVQAAEAGDLQIFKEEILKKPSSDAFSLAYVMAIQCERLNILQFYYSGDHVKSLKLFTDPMVTASRNDKINSFQFLLRKGLQMPNDILGPIFHDNSKLIMAYIIGDSLLAKEILKEKFQTDWAKKGLLKKDNESTKMYKDLVNGG